MANLYDYKFGRELTDVPNVVSHSASYGYDATDVCTVRILTDEREGWRKRLLNQYFQVVRKSDSFVEFRGEVKETRLDNTDRYNLTLKIKDPTWRLGELDVSAGNAQIREPRKITTVTTTVITDDTNPTDDEPAGYTSADNAVMIVPAEEGSFTNEDVEDSVTSLGSIQGGTGFAELNDQDPDTSCYSINTAATTEWIRFNGSSANAKATVIGVAFNVVCKTRIDNKTTVMKLQYLDDDGTTWTDIGNASEDYNGRIESTYYYLSEEVELEGYLATNQFLDGADDWAFRVLVTKSASTNLYLKVVSVQMDIYTDNVHTSTYFPIDSYSATSDALTVLVDPDNSLNPVTGGVAVGDTYMIGKKDLTALTGIFTLYPKYQLPITTSIDANFTGYTCKDFGDGTLLDAIEYFCEREIAHWWFDHNTNTLEIDKESTILAVAEHEIVAANTDKFSLSDKTDSNVKSVTIYGASYRRKPTEDEVQVTYTYPTDTQNDTIGEAAFTALRNLKVDDPGIRSKSEAAKLAASIYAMRNDVNPSITVTTNTREELWLGERVKMTLDSIVYETTFPCSAITIDHSVADNDITQMVTGGWQRTTLIQRQGNVIRKMAKNIRNLQKETRVSRPTSQIPTVASGDVVADSVVVAASGTITLGEDGDIIFQHGANNSTISKTEDVDEVVFSGDHKVINGTYRAESIAIGDQVLSESGQLFITDPVTPGVKIIDSGDTGVNASHLFQFVDDSAEEQFEIKSETRNIILNAIVGNMYLNTKAGGFYDFWIDENSMIQISSTYLRPAADNTHDLGTATEEFKDLFLDGTAHIDTLDVDVNATGITLSMIENTTADKLFTFANKGLKFLYTGANPGAYDGMFELEMTGNLQADVMHIHQHTGNVVAGSKLLHLHGEDTDLLELEISGQGPVLSIQDTGDSDEELLEFDNTARTMRVGAADGNDNIASSFYGTVGIDGNDLAGALMIGSGNAAWVPLSYEGDDNAIVPIVYGGIVMQNSTSNCDWTWRLTMPATRGGLSLYITGVRVHVHDADANHFLDKVRVFGNQCDATPTQTELAVDDTNRTSPETYTTDFASLDVSSYTSIAVHTNTSILNTLLAFDIGGVDLECYYA